MKLLKNAKIITAVLALGLAGAVQASNDAHTWTTVYSKNGAWVGQLASIYENASFVDQNGNAVKQFPVNIDSPFTYGFTYGEGDDFNVAYSVTLTQQSTQGLSSQFTSKTCVFIVTATSPAHPDIQVLSYNGAKCSSPNKSGSKFYVE